MHVSAPPVPQGAARRTSRHAFAGVALHRKKAVECAVRPWGIALLFLWTLSMGELARNSLHHISWCSILLALVSSNVFMQLWLTLP